MVSQTIVGALGGAVLFAGLAVYGGVKARHSWHLRNAITNAAAASPGTIRAGQGPVEITGTARVAEHSFTSPLTEQECVAYRFVKEEKQRQHVDAGTDEPGDDYKWVTIHDEEAGAPFYVAGDGGRTLVDASTADLDMDRSYEVDTDDVTAGVGERVVASVKGLVGSESGEDSHEIPRRYVEELQDAHRERRYKEWVVHDGEEVYVYGEAVTPEQTPIGSGGDAADAESTDSQSLLETLDGIGSVQSGAEDPRARYESRAMERLPDDSGDSDAGDGEVRAARSGTGSRPGTPALDDASEVISWGATAPTFVVSDQGKKAVVRDFSTGIAKWGALTVGSTALAVVAAAYVLGLF